MPTFAAVEVPARHADVAGVLAWLDRVLPTVVADVVVLPEACLTGYVSPEGDADLRRFAEEVGGPLEQELAERARRFGIHLGWPLIEREGDCYFNAYCMTAPDGVRIAHYRKRHPWYLETWAAPGENTYPVFSLLGMRAMLAICFDVHFLAEEATDELDQSDVLLFPSAWVEEADSRASLFLGIARGHGVSIVNANWGVGDVVIAGQGASRIVGADGRELACAAPGGMAIAVLD
jgi:predicted amidohydrolase